jgi:CheY-like chemotaxis protein
MEGYVEEMELEMETGKNISVVDDNISLRIAVSKRLSRLGYDVLSADSGKMD